MFSNNENGTVESWIASNPNIRHSLPVKRSCQPLSWSSHRASLQGKYPFSLLFWISKNYPPVSPLHKWHIAELFLLLPSVLLTVCSCIYCGQKTTEGVAYTAWYGVNPLYFVFMMGLHFIVACNYRPVPPLRNCFAHDVGAIICLYLFELGGHVIQVSDNVCFSVKTPNTVFGCKLRRIRVSSSALRLQGITGLVLVS